MISLIRAWILISAACVSAGWILSALHQLNWVGYAVYFPVFAAAVWFFRGLVEDSGKSEVARPRAFRWNWRRYRRPLPLLFFLTALLAIVGGTVHAPNNYDAQTYRFPRLLHWWAESGWHWIPSPNLRMNLSGANFEWLMSPLFVLTHSDQLFFLINIAAYLLLPGLVFLVFLGAGAPRRVAWFWMWLTPAGLCYAMQAGSISNDTIAVIYFLAAIFFCFQAKKNGRVANLWLALLSTGLLTGVKGSNLPLILPMAWALWPTRTLVMKRFGATMAVFLLSLLISYVPTAYLNQRYTGDWSGDPGNVEKAKITKPLAGILGNGLQLALQSLEPPFLPLARTAENWVWQRFPDKLRAVLMRDFPRFVVGFRELPQEESAGLGITITFIAIISVAADFIYTRRKKQTGASLVVGHGMAVGVATWIALLVYMSKLGSESTSRLIAAYYPLLLLPLILNPAQNILVRKFWYRFLAIVSCTIALLAVILTPSRPLWPAEIVFDWAVARYPKNELLSHAKMVFTVYRYRNDIFGGLRQNIPATVKVIGLIEGEDDAEASLWRPFGERKVVLIQDIHQVRAVKLEWIVVKNKTIGPKNSSAFEDWVRDMGGVLVAERDVTEKAGGGPEKWSVVQLPGAEN